TGKPSWNVTAFGTGHGEMAFSADGRRFALGYVNGKAGFVQVWDAPAGPDDGPFGRPVARYSGHVGAVNAVAASPDGAKRASGGDARRVKVWKLPAAGERGPGLDGPGSGAPFIGMPIGTPPMLAPEPIAPAPAPKAGRPIADPDGERKAAE